MKKLLIIATIFFLALNLQAQSAVQGDQDTTEVVQQERVYGFWEVMGYVGGKLTSELSSRLNLETDKQETVPTEVKVEFGWIKFTRVEDRPVKK